jgi:hypothetical protein
MGYCERAVGSCGAVPSTRSAFGRHSAEFATTGHDHRPAPFKGSERNDAVHAVAADNAGFGSEAVPYPKCTEEQATCTEYLHSMPVYCVCMDGRSISFKPVDSIAMRPVVFTQAACADHFRGAYRL